MPVPLPGRAQVFGTFAVALAASLFSFAARPASLQIDGRHVASDVAPVTQAYHAYVPLRVVAREFGATTMFDRTSGTIEVIRGDDTVRLRVGAKTATLNGHAIVLHAAPFTVHGRAMIGLQTLAQAFGAATRYDGARGKIDVISPGIVQAAPAAP